MDQNTWIEIFRPKISVKIWGKMRAKQWVEKWVENVVKNMGKFQVRNGVKIKKKRLSSEKNNKAKTSENREYFAPPPGEVYHWKESWSTYRGTSTTYKGDVRGDKWRGGGDWGSGVSENGVWVKNSEGKAKCNQFVV